MPAHAAGHRQIDEACGCDPRGTLQDRRTAPTIDSMLPEDHISGTAPQPGPAPAADPSARLLANPMLLAGGALVAGVIIGRVLGSDDSRGKRLVDEIAEAILNRSGAAAPAEGNAVPAVERLVQEFRPQLDSVAENLSKMLADLFRK